MKVTKRQLRQIIREEKQKLLRESITDMKDYEDNISAVALQLTDNFGEDMMEMYREDPGMFQGQTRDDWEQQVVYAQQELENALEEAISQAIQSIETQLHDGEYYTGDATSSLGRR